MSEFFYFLSMGKNLDWPGQGFTHINTFKYNTSYRVHKTVVKGEIKYKTNKTSTHYCTVLTHYWRYNNNKMTRWIMFSMHVQRIMILYTKIEIKKKEKETVWKRKHWRRIVIIINISPCPHYCLFVWQWILRIFLFIICTSRSIFNIPIYVHV